MFFKYRSINMYYEKYGNSNKVIIILPGFGDTRMTFTNLIHHLQDNFTIYIPDFPGFGKTLFPTYDMTIYDYSFLINKWISSLNVENPTLIGHSFGGRIIITLLGYYKYKYDNIILIDAAGIKKKKTLFARIKQLTYKVLKRIIRSDKGKKRLLKLFASADYKMIPNNMRKSFQYVVNEDLTSYIPNIKSKTLIIWGANDNITPLKDAYKLNRLIKNSELIVLENTNHYAYLGRENLVSDIIKEQLR